MNEVKNQQTNSMVEVFVNFLSYILLGISATAAGFLYFQAINKFFPDYQYYQFSGYFNPAGIHYAIAALVISFPIYIFAMRFWFSAFNSAIEKTESRLSKWLTYIVLFIASGTIIGDLIAVVFNFLQGEYSARFLLKALTIIVIAGVVFGFYFFERKKIQYKKPISSGAFVFFAAVSIVLVLLSIVFGFIVGGTPMEARLRNLDIRRADDLNNLSNCASNFSYDNARLPKELNEIVSNVRYNYCSSNISDPETGKEYEYKIISENEFELCAEFARSTLDELSNGRYGTWQLHDKGRVCETQTVTFGTEPSPIKPLPLPAR